MSKDSAELIRSSQPCCRIVPKRYCQFQYAETGIHGPASADTEVVLKIVSTPGSASAAMYTWHDDWLHAIVGSPFGHDLECCACAAAMPARG